MTVLVEVFGPLTIVGAAAIVALLGNKSYASRKDLEQKLLDVEVDRDVLKERESETQAALEEAQYLLEDAMKKAESLAAEVSDVVEEQRQLVIEKEATRKALAAEVEIRVAFQNENHSLKSENDGLRAELNELRAKHERFLTTRSEIVRDLGIAQRKNDEWEERWDAHQRMQSTTELAWNHGREENRRLREYNEGLRQQILKLEKAYKDQSAIIDLLRERGPARAKNGRFAKKSPHGDCVPAV